MGGVDVHPKRIVAVLLRHTAVAQAALRLMRRQADSRLQAFVVPQEPGCNEAALPGSLAAEVDAQLASVERPRAFTSGAVLPRTPMGRLVEWLLSLS